MIEAFLEGKVEKTPLKMLLRKNFQTIRFITFIE